MSDNKITKVEDKEKKNLTWKEVYQNISKELTQYTAEDLEIIRKNVAKDTNVSEFKYFLNIAIGSGLNPFLKEIWCYKDGKGNQIIFAGRDGFLKKAQENPSFNGIRSCEIRANDEFSIDVANNKITHNVKSLDNKERGEITGAYAIAFRKDGEPTIELADFATYNKKYNTWSSHPAEMIKKVAEVHALKKAFGISVIQSDEDFTIKGDIVTPVGDPDSKPKVKISDEQFKKMLAMPDEYLEDHRNELDLTEKQEKLLIERLNQNA